MQLKKDELDDYHPGRVIPYFLLGLRLVDLKNPKILNQRLTFNGIDRRILITLSRVPQAAAVPEG